MARELSVANPESHCNNFYPPSLGLPLPSTCTLKRWFVNFFFYHALFDDLWTCLNAEYPPIQQIVSLPIYLFVRQMICEVVWIKFMCLFVYKQQLLNISTVMMHCIWKGKGHFTIILQNEVVLSFEHKTRSSSLPHPNYSHWREINADQVLMPLQKITTFIVG